MSEKPEDFLSEQHLSCQLRATWDVAGVGIAVVIGIVTIVPARIVYMNGWLNTTPTLIAVLILGLTLPNILELLGGSNEHGGTSTLVHDELRDSSEFLSGWTLLGALIALAAAMINSLGQSLATLNQTLSTWPAWLTAFGFQLLALIHILHLLPRRESLTPLVTLLLFILVELFLTTILGLTTPAPSVPPSGYLLDAVAWSITLFAGIKAEQFSRRCCVPRWIIPAITGVNRRAAFTLTAHDPHAVPALGHPVAVCRRPSTTDFDISFW